MAPKMSFVCFTSWFDFFINLGMYLIVITKKTKVGDLLDHAVWKALNFDIVSYKKTVLHLNDDQVGYFTIISLFSFKDLFIISVHLFCNLTIKKDMNKLNRI